LGLSDEEFNRSTLAKIAALYRLQVLVWDRNRDYFICELIAITLNKTRTEEGQKVWTADDLLLLRYPALKSDSKSVTITPKHDPDFGALGGAELKSALKGITDKKKRKARRQKHANRT